MERQKKIEKVCFNCRHWVINFPESEEDRKKGFVPNSRGLEGEYPDKFGVCHKGTSKKGPMHATSGCNVLKYNNQNRFTGVLFEAEIED